MTMYENEMAGEEARRLEAERLQELEAAANQPHPEAWIPAKEGDSIGGRITGIKMLTGAYGDVPVVTIANPAGVEQSLWLHHATLRGEFHKQRIMPGELVYVRYDGKVSPKSGVGNDYHVYTVRVDRAETPFDWDAQLGVHPDAVPVQHERPDASAPLAGAEFPTSPADDDIPF